ncbi:unnamed protein product [Adineta ricciae]|uniref:Uncharacterized protein n=1 Tax=Adineta ricciae TaxID=249248 RepID=A0A815UVB4_ADIRI|nr:unnamed protein product [Adineta ricciae]CAF1522561.1 unnamed protein product [Adineta ricciae]
MELSILMVERILHIHSCKLNEILIQLKYRHSCLNTCGLGLLNEFVSLLTLLAEVVTKTQQQNGPTISLIAPSTLAIYNDLKDEKNNVHYMTPLCTVLL